MGYYALGISFQTCLPFSVLVMEHCDLSSFAKTLTYLKNLDSRPATSNVDCAYLKGIRNALSGLAEGDAVESGHSAQQPALHTF